MFDGEGTGCYCGAYFVRCYVRCYGRLLILIVSASSISWPDLTLSGSLNLTCAGIGCWMRTGILALMGTFSSL